MPNEKFFKILQGSKVLCPWSSEIFFLHAPWIMIHVSLKVKSFPMIEKSFGVIKMIKLLGFQGPWVELHVRVCSVGVLGRVAWFSTAAAIAFIGWALSIAQFWDFPNFLRSWVLSSSATREELYTMCFIVFIE